MAKSVTIPVKQIVDQLLQGELTYFWPGIVLTEEARAAFVGKTLALHIRGESFKATVERADTEHRWGGVGTLISFVPEVAADIEIRENH